MGLAGAKAWTSRERLPWETEGGLAWGNLGTEEAWPLSPDTQDRRCWALSGGHMAEEEDEGQAGSSHGPSWTRHLTAGTSMAQGQGSFLI